MAANHNISVANDFSPFPAGRFLADGKFSGERFRDEFLVPALREHDHVSINMDDVFGFGSSFLEEAFGGLVRIHGFTAHELRKALTLSGGVKSDRLLVWRFIDDAQVD